MKRRHRIMIKKAEERVRELMPGKTLEDVSKMYEEFYDEFEALKNVRKPDWEKILICLDKYKDVLEIADMFPEIGTETWASYRGAVAFMLEHKDFLN